VSRERRARARARFAPGAFGAATSIPIPTKGTPMKLGLVLGYSGKRVSIDMAPVLEAERLGFDSVWTAEAYGSDAVSTAAWVLSRTTRIKVGTAIMQMPARTPA
jgi:hypothetical protein